MSLPDGMPYNDRIMLAFRSPLVARAGAAFIVGLACAVTAAGCGLTLDTDPAPEKTPFDGGRMDGSAGDGAAGDASVDGAVTDGGPADAMAADAMMPDGGIPCEAGCDDGNECTKDACDTSVGRCAHEPLTDTPCDDGNACTTEACHQGTCTVMQNVTCATNEACQPDTGECDCISGFARCGNICVRETSIQCDPGAKSTDTCGGCGDRTCLDNCTWGTCVPYAGNDCIPSLTDKCGPDGECQLCVSCNLSVSLMLSCTDALCVLP